MTSSHLPHQPVLLQAVLTALNPKPEGWYIDGTFGRGGHSRALLTHLNEQGRLLAFDCDPDAIQAAQPLCNTDPRFNIIHSSYDQLTTVLTQRGWLGKVDGLLLDLGVSSPQLDAAERGFSFMRDGALDMRMNPQQGESVADWLAHAKTTDIAQVLHDYGEERHARRIARAITTARDTQPLTRTRQLAEIIATAHPQWEIDKHPATRSFQALRIFINDELGRLTRTLPQTLQALKIGGKLAIISFHSLEDRIVKRFMRDAARGDHYPIDLPIMTKDLHPKLTLLGKPIFPEPEEIATNPRARSAVLRIAEKTAE